MDNQQPTPVKNRKRKRSWEGNFATRLVGDTFKVFNPKTINPQRLNKIIQRHRRSIKNLEKALVMEPVVNGQHDQKNSKKIQEIDNSISINFEGIQKIDEKINTNLKEIQKIKEEINKNNDRYQQIYDYVVKHLGVHRGGGKKHKTRRNKRRNKKKSKKVRKMRKKTKRSKKSKKKRKTRRRK
mgnify:CR=1 FL=1